MEGTVRAGKAADLKPGETTFVIVGEGEPVLVANVSGELYAVSNICTHAGGALSDGELEGQVVECPLHGSRFDVATGEVVDGPAQEALQRYTARVEGEDILISSA